MRSIEIDPSMMFRLLMCVNKFLGQILMHIYIYGIKKEINAFMRIFCNLKNRKMAHSLSFFLQSLMVVIYFTHIRRRIATKLLNCSLTFMSQI